MLAPRTGERAVPLSYRTEDGPTAATPVQHKASRERERPEGSPPVAHAPGSPKTRRPRMKTAATLPGKVKPSNGLQPHFDRSSSRRTAVGRRRFSTVSEPT